MDIEKFGETLRSLRKNRGLTQRDCANVLEITETTYGNWERGKRGPDISFLPKIADLFNVNINSLFDYMPGHDVTSALGLSWSLTRSPTNNEKIGLNIWEQLAEGKSFASIIQSSEIPIWQGEVERYLKDMLYTNLIDITKVPYDDQLSEDLRNGFLKGEQVELREGAAIVVKVGKETPDLFRKVLIGEAARSYYKENVYDGMGVAISGGTTTSHFVRALKRGECKNVEFYPLANSPETHTVAIDANTLVGILVAHNEGYNTRGYALLYTSQKDLDVLEEGKKETFSDQAASTSSTLARARNADVVFMSVGTVEQHAAQRSDMMRSILIKDHLTFEKMKDAGVVGDLLFHFTSRDGNWEKYEAVNELICSVKPSELQEMVKRNKSVVLLATGAEKAEITRVAIEHKFVNELIIDDELAQALLKLLDKAPASSAKEEDLESL